MAVVFTGALYRVALYESWLGLIFSVAALVGAIFAASGVAGMIRAGRNDSAKSEPAFDLGGERYCHLLDPRSGQPVMHTQALTVLITPRPQAGTLSDMASKPLFIAGEDWSRLAGKLAADHVLRVDAKGGIEVSPALRERLEFVAGSPHPREIAIPAGK